ncbi:hypothetical protein ABES80_10265 [Bacillus gobiensis]|uniref:hypothetical protein n=1 Tax=Bacillus gobiensis TaxID=1441095 RepID=UPI003D1ACBEB
MADKISQRNKFDVAMELLNLYIRNASVNPDDFGKIFSEYYALADTLSRADEYYLKTLVPDEILEKLERK